MHETGVCRSIVDTVLYEAFKARARRVVEVHLVMGEVHDAVPELLVGAFAHMTRGTIAEGARLDIRRVPFTVRCDDCGEVFALDAHDESTWHCPRCRSKAYRLHTGREFAIEDVVVEGGFADARDTEAPQEGLCDSSGVRVA